MHRPHHALGDALTTAQVFIALATLLDGYGPQTVRTLSLAGQRARALGVYSTGSRGGGRSGAGSGDHMISAIIVSDSASNASSAAGAEPAFRRAA